MAMGLMAREKSYNSLSWGNETRVLGGLGGKCTFLSTWNSPVEGRKHEFSFALDCSLFVLVPSTVP